MAYSILVRWVNRTTGRGETREDRPMTYTIQTDAFSCEIEADTLDAAIAEAFEGECMGKIDSLESLKAKFPRKVWDGEWVEIEADGKTIFSFGDH